MEVYIFPILFVCSALYCLFKALEAYDKLNKKIKKLEQTNQGGEE